MKKKIVSLILCISMCLGITSVLSACSSGRPDALVIMTEELDGLFNPFYSTTAADGTIVSMTQIGMLSSKLDAGGDVTVAFGDTEAVVTKDYESVYDAVSDTTTYTFVIKNGLEYSDGHALTIEDVLFNLYVYLDPVYTGSSTMYSTDILGLKDYRTQTSGSSDSDSEAIAATAKTLANNRINELINLFKTAGRTETAGTYEIGIDEMKAAILAHGLNSGYKEAVSTKPNEVTNEQLLADYEKTLQYFREELEDDYVSSKEAYDVTKAPYKDWKQYFGNEVFCFMYTEGFVEVEYAKIGGKDDKSTIEEITLQYPENIVTDMESAIDYVYNSKVSSELHIILQYWATAQRLMTEYTAKGTEIALRSKLTGDELLVKNIEGIVSLGHTTDVTTVTVNGNSYTVAHEHKADGSPANNDEYDVLQITIDGIDPKAVWNFSFAVAPQHYYAEGREVNIEENEFGVEFGTFSFMTDEIQSVRNVKVPMGAGAYMATNAANGTPNAEGTDFFKDNVVYFKANDKFMFDVATDKIRYQVVSSSNALNALISGTVHYVTPQLTDDNIKKIEAASKKGITSMYTDQLGYGYIGINAGKVTDINLRRAIMSAMDISLSRAYYQTGTATNIYWPMSKVSWAYPDEDYEDGAYENDNGHRYPAINFSKSAAKTAILDYMEAAGVSEGAPELSIKFTIAGSNLTDHPTYNTFIQAAEILNECGWDIEVVADTQALTKLSTGSLAVWAAAWGSTVDPDMYQVYHKNSTATSVLAWGYREILNDPSRVEENQILNELSDLIDEARENDDRAYRTDKYVKAMRKILDLAVELPVYQRSVLYAYNENVIDSTSLPAESELNPYSSPLDKIWEVRLVTELADGNEGLGTGAIIGIVAGAVVLLGGGAAAFVILSKKKKGAPKIVAADGEDVVVEDDIVVEDDSEN